MSRAATIERKRRARKTEGNLWRRFNILEETGGRRKGERHGERKRGGVKSEDG